MCTNPKITYKINDKILPVKEIKRLEKGMLDIQDKNNIVEIKCGTCLECRKENRLEITNRLKEELKINKEAFFITLTYDENHKKELNKRDLQLFFKRYRKKQELRYFYVGELGETTKRPHYHAIIFTKMPEDLKETPNKTKNNYTQYESKEIQKLWGNGLIRISKMETPLIGYITKYMLKNENKKEFISGWSKNPPIGINVMTFEKDINKKNRTKALKRYYKHRYNEIPKNEIEIEKEQIKKEEIEKQTNLKYIDYIRKKMQ